jgi:ketosteroid isomerase-like protein
VNPLTERDPEIQRLIDEAAIRRLIALYPRALDRHDHDLLASMFHPDAIDDHGPANGPVSNFLALMRERSRAGVHWTHHYGNQIIELEGDTAFVETYCIALCRQGAVGEEGYGREILLRLRYLDRVEKRDGVWKIAHRKLVYSPCRVAESFSEYASPGECIFEAPWPDDPVYRWR